MDYVYLWQFWRYIAEVTLSGNYGNQFLDKLPTEIYDCALEIGKWIAGIIF